MSKKKKTGVVGTVVLVVALATVATGIFVALKGLAEDMDFNFADEADEAE